MANASVVWAIGSRLNPNDSVSLDGHPKQHQGTQTVTATELAKRHGKWLVSACKMLNIPITNVFAM